MYAFGTVQARCQLDTSKLLAAGTAVFFNNPTLSDITLVCPDGRQLHCHQVILAAACSRLATVLQSGEVCGMEVVGV